MIYTITLCLLTPFAIILATRRYLNYRDAVLRKLIYEPVEKWVNNLNGKLVDVENGAKVFLYYNSYATWEKDDKKYFSTLKVYSSEKIVETKRSVVK